MAEQKKKGRSGLTSSANIEPPGRQKALTPAPVSPTGALFEHQALCHAVDGFVRGNTNFESSVPINTALDEIGKCADLQTVFTVPLQHKLFTMDSALRWALFLSVAPARAVEEGDAPFSVGKKFSAQTALELVSSVYDIGVQEVVWEHFEPDDEEDDDEEDEDAEEK